MRCGAAIASGQERARGVSRAGAGRVSVCLVGVRGWVGERATEGECWLQAVGTGFASAAAGPLASTEPNPCAGTQLQIHAAQFLAKGRLSRGCFNLFPAVLHRGLSPGTSWSYAWMPKALSLISICLVAGPADRVSRQAPLTSAALYEERHARPEFPAFTILPSHTPCPALSVLSVIICQRCPAVVSGTRPCTRIHPPSTHRVLSADTLRSLACPFAPLLPRTPALPSLTPRSRSLLRL